MTLNGATRVLPSNVNIDYSLFNYGYGTTIDHTPLMHYIDEYNKMTFSIDIQTTIDGDYVYLIDMSYTLISGYMENDTFFLTSSMLATTTLLDISSSVEFRGRPDRIVLLYYNNELHLKIHETSIPCDGIHFHGTSLYVRDVLSIMKQQKFLEIHD